MMLQSLKAAIIALIVATALPLSAMAQQDDDAKKKAESAKQHEASKQKVNKVLEGKKSAIEGCIKEFGLQKEKGGKFSVTLGVTVTPEGEVVGSPTISVSAPSNRVRIKSCIERRLGSLSFSRLNIDKNISVGITHSFEYKKQEVVKPGEKKEVKGSGVYGVPSYGYGGGKTKEELGSPQTEANP